MYALLISAISLMGTLASAPAAGGQGPDAVSGQPEPCYVVIAIDVSGRMESDDAPLAGSDGRRQTLRDEGQLLFLQLLPFLYSDLYMGLVHFSDRPRYTLPSEATGPLLPWGQTFLNESACRNLVRPVEFQGSFRSDIAESMSWASDRIQAARRQYGQGPGKLILLSNGDPSECARELARGNGPILNRAKRLTEQQIRVYPILIDSASFRAGQEQAQPANREPAVEDLMYAMASMTGGKGYRLARDQGFADILLDIFGLGTPVRGDVVVSPHDWAMVAVGSSLDLVSVAALEEGGGGRPRALVSHGGLVTAPEIRANLISAGRHQVTILRRPDSAAAVSRSWQGRWTVALPGNDPQASVRIYRIPDFLLQLEATPELPWWRHERVQVQARLRERHPKVASPETAGAPAAGQSLSMRIRGVSADGTNSFLLEKGHWTTPGHRYETEPFVIGVPGLYKLTGELQDAVAKVSVPVLHATIDAYVHAECVGLQVVNAATDQVLQEVPAEAGRIQIDAQGGQQVYFRAYGKGEFNVEPLSGVLHLEPLPQTQWPLGKDSGGRLVTDVVGLIEREEQLAGWIEVDVRTFVGVRHMQFPRFEMAYAPAPLRVECTFTDPRPALWVGEYHKQPLTISAFPVFDRFREQALYLFPETLPDARIQSVDRRSGVRQAIGPDSRLLEPPQPSGYGGRTLAATYFLEASVPIPPADKCEIDLSAAVANLQGATKTYAVVDPVAQGLFQWTVQQGQSGPQGRAVSEALFCGEPVRFAAQWRADQNISGVRFEIPRPAPAEPAFVELPVAAGADQAQTEQVVSGLRPGEDLPVYVHVTIQPSGADHPLHIKLKAGQFRAEDRRIVLRELALGDGTPTDIPANAWEAVEIPLRAVFGGYVASDLQHSAAIEQFKSSCVVTVTPKPGDVQDITRTIEWSSVTAESATKTCELQGHATYTPQTTGRMAIELSVEAPAVKGAADEPIRHAYAQVLVREPRLAVTVHRLTPNRAEPVFDSRKWVRGEGGISALTSRLSTRLRIDVRGGSQAGSSGPWKTVAKLLRRLAPDGEWTVVSTETGEWAANGSLVREVQITENGEYALEVAGQDVRSGQTVSFQTPVIALLRQYEVIPAVAPPAWLTSRVRQWPFTYRVTLYQDSAGPSRPQSVAFQFQLPAQPETWLEGAAAPAQPEIPDVEQLLAQAPRFLPPVGALTDGKVQFRLSAQGMEFLRWECPNIRVIPPVLEGLVLSARDKGGALELHQAGLAFGGGTDLWVRPVFRAAPELEGQWIPSQVTVYLWRGRDAGPAGGQAEVRVLEDLSERANAAGSGPDLRTFNIDGPAPDQAVKILPRRARWNIWGWPRRGAKEHYSLAAAVTYRPSQTAASAVGPAGTSRTDRTIAEWSDVYAIDRSLPWAIPLMWWPLTVVLVAAGMTMLLRLLVPKPHRLALDLRLEENVAIVEPVRFDNPVLLDLHETPLTREIQLYTRYLLGRWDRARAGGSRSGPVGGTVSRALLQGVALVAGPLHVLLRRVFLARRCAWAAIIPRIRGNVRHMHTGLVCVWTGLRARRGRIWSSQGGAFEPPPERQVKSINLDLPYQVDNVDRTIRVTVRVRRMASEERAMTAPGWQAAGSDLLP
jgi:hypothetical protein